MTLTKNHYTIIAVVIGLIAVWYFFLRKKPVESNFKAAGVSYPNCKRECGRCTPTNTPCIGAGGYLVD